MDDSKPTKDGWDKTQIIATLIAAVLIPVALGLSSFWLNDNMKNRELAAQNFAQERDRRLRIFEVAVGILQQDPKNNPETSALRKWAINVFVDFSGEQVPEKARRELEKKPLPRLSGASTSLSSLPGEMMPGESLPGGPPIRSGQK
jgi:hypothetical protein